MFFSASASLTIFAYSTVYVYNRVILTTRWPGQWAPSNQIFAIQFKCIAVFMTKKFFQVKYSIELITTKTIAGGNVLCFSNLGQVTYKI